VPYPDPLDDPDNIEPDLITNWAHVTKVELDIEAVENFIKEATEKGEDPSDA